MDTKLDYACSTEKVQSGWKKLDLHGNGLMSGWIYIFLTTKGKICIYIGRSVVNSRIITKQLLCAVRMMCGQCSTFIVPQRSEVIEMDGRRGLI